MDTPLNSAEEPTPDVEGHLAETKDDDDVEGHARHMTTDQDDVEGHLSFAPSHYLGDGSTPADGLPFKPGRAVKADRSDDVSGHDMRPGRTTE